MKFEQPESKTPEGGREEIYETRRMPVPGAIAQYFEGGAERWVTVGRGGMLAHPGSKFLIHFHISGTMKEGMDRDLMDLHPVTETAKTEEEAREKAEAFLTDDSKWEEVLK